MEIKDFIKEALLQIVDGVTSANDELKSKGAYIPTRNVVGDSILATLDRENGTTKTHIKVDFDLAVVLTHADSTKLDGSLKTSYFIVIMVQRYNKFSKLHSFECEKYKKLHRF